MRTLGWLLWLGDAGCVAAHSGLSARPLGQGALEAGLHGGVIPTPEGDLSSAHLTVRMGVSDSTDLVLGLGTEGLGFGVKSTATRPGSPIAVALAPEVAALPGLWFGNLFHAGVPLLVGVPLGPHEITVGPRIDWFHFDSLAGALARVNTTAVGATVDLSLRLGPVRLVPEVAVAQPIARSAYILDETAAFEPLVAPIQYSLFLLFERRCRAERE